MATTSNTYTGNGSNKLFSITFPYLDTADVDVYLNGTLQTITTQYTFANATTVEFVTAPANGATILLDRSTDDTDLQATFFPGSAIKAADLNLDFDQVLYIAQETANDVTTATSSAASAVTTANTASSNATAAVNTANTASTNASTAVTTANNAVTTANNAVTTANNAVTTANTANTNSNTAISTANAASAAVANALLYTIVANVAAIPGSPINLEAVEVTNSTGIESFTPLSGLPAGFIGSSELSVRIVYQTSVATWTWIQYFPNDPETRYLKLAGGTVTGNLEIGTAGSLSFEGATADAFETTIAVVDPTADRTITLPDTTGTVVTTGDTGTVTSTMILDGTILNADVNASAAIAGTKISPDFGSQTVTTTGVISAALGAVGTPSITFTGDTNTGIYSPAADTLAFVEGGTEAMRLDSGGRLLLGTTSSITNRVAAGLQVVGTGADAYISATRYSSTAGEAPGIILGRSKSATEGTNTIVADGDLLGELTFSGASGTTFEPAASITAFVDGTPGFADMPGRLVFSTTSDGASATTERARITSAGSLLVGTVSQFAVSSSTATGSYFTSIGIGTHYADGSPSLYLGRQTTDGSLVVFSQAGVAEGSITVTGTTVSYNGAHLSRWSQLPSGAERTEILRGTVLSNIDEMCEWNEEDNEQLNRMKVSDVEGDKNVSGVFQAWDDDDDTYTDDFYCAMTGDFIIRIAEGVTVERGDLLMSAGDGTAKPQDDDIIRSKTIAKVTSTNVSCTYEDGSYCVPCVLMAC